MTVNGYEMCDGCGLPYEPERDADGNVKLQGCYDCLLILCPSCWAGHADTCKPVKSATEGWNRIVSNFSRETFEEWRNQ